MSIDKADARLTAYVFGELSETEKVALEAEFARDEAARAQLTELRRTVAALRFEFSETKAPELEAERREKIVQTVHPARNQKRRQRLWGAASLASSAALLLLYAAISGSGHDAPPMVKYIDSPIATTDTAAPHELTPNPRRATPIRRGPLMMAPSEPVQAAPQAPDVRGRGEFDLGTPPAPHAPDVRGLHGLSSSHSVAPKKSPSGGVLGLDGSPRAANGVEPPSAPQANPGYGGTVVATPSVNAGEWDDNANYREFMRWTASAPAPGAHPIDVRDRRFIVVRDSAGLGVPNCRVVVTDESDRQTELITTAAGRAILFPHAEGLGGRTFSAATECAGGARKAFSLSGPDGVIDLHTAQPRALPEQTIDVAFILDSTGSMAEEITAVKNTIQKVTRGLRGSNVRIRLGLVEYKDRSDSFVTRVFAMSADLEGFSRQVSGVQATGGGDMPESVNEALHVGIHDLAWNDRALARLAFLVGDAPPHLDYPQDYDYALEAKEAAHRGIQIYTIAASGMDTLGQVVWRQVAQYTGASNLFVLRGGAGPQSVGAGDPKSSCGGTQTSYTSGNLDALVLAKINGVLRALERDPLRIAGLNTDENAKPCAERVPIGQ